MTTLGSTERPFPVEPPPARPVGEAMLVLGRRHHHELFGSVSRASLRRASCVVVLVPSVIPVLP